MPASATTAAVATTRAARRGQAGPGGQAQRGRQHDERGAERGVVPVERGRREQHGHDEHRRAEREQLERRARRAAHPRRGDEQQDGHRGRHQQGQSAPPACPAFGGELAKTCTSRNATEVRAGAVRASWATTTWCQSACGAARAKGSSGRTAPASTAPAVTAAVPGRARRPRRATATSTSAGTTAQILIVHARPSSRPARTTRRRPASASPSKASATAPRQHSTSHGSSSGVQAAAIASLCSASTAQPRVTAARPRCRRISAAQGHRGGPGQAGEDLRDAHGLGRPRRLGQQRHRAEQQHQPGRLDQHEVAVGQPAVDQGDRGGQVDAAVVLRDRVGVAEGQPVEPEGGRDHGQGGHHGRERDRGDAPPSLSGGRGGRDGHARHRPRPSDRPPRDPVTVGSGRFVTPTRRVPLLT